MKRKYLIYISFLILTACNKSSNFNHILKESGDNCVELEKVLEHYSQNASDSLKLKAAKFLIINMPAHYSVNSDDFITYFSYMDSIFAQEDNFFRLDSVYKKYIEKHPTVHPQIFSDLKNIKAEYIIRNIDMSFDSWKTNWNKHLSFEEFCEYILPYRIDDEILEPWRDLFLNRYSYVFEPDDYSSLTTINACAKLNNELKKMKIQIHYNPTYVKVIRPSSMIDMKFGVCKDYSNFGIFAMRSFGIPTAIDYIPSGHTWNVVITPHGTVDFSAAEHDPGEHLKNWKRIPKVHRQTYAVNSESLIFSYNNEDIPLVFRNPCYLDVTKSYFTGSDINIKLDDVSAQTKTDLLYLCVYYSYFRFTDWSKIRNRRAVFKNMGDSTVYFPVYYSRLGMEHACYPVLIKKEGKEKVILKPNYENPKTLILYRKHPIKDHHQLFLNRAIGGVFEGANRADFSDAKILYKIEKLPELKMNFVELNNQYFRFLRYLAPNGSHCSFAEIEFYESGNLSPLKGKIIGTEGCYMHSPDCTKEKVFDGNILTYFDAPNPDGAWVGMDLGEKKLINKIQYITRNDDNGVRPGEMYELFFMDQKGWKSMGRKVAEADSLIYSEVPGEAIYLLKNLSKGNEECIFTYEKGKQIWW